MKNIKSSLDNKILKDSSESFPLNMVVRNEPDLFSISHDGLLYGYVLDKNIIKEKYKDVNKKFSRLYKIALLQKRNLINESIQISNELKKHKINHVFLKGTALHFLNPELFSLRLFRDIDILVDDNFLTDTYEIAKGLGYSYYDKYVNDEVFPPKIRHHLPTLHKKNNSLLEIHTRITKKEDFETCPLAEISFQKKICVSKNEIFIQNIDSLFNHIFYHGIKNQKTGSRIQMLLDLSLIAKNYDVKKSDFSYSRITKFNFDEIISDIIKNFDESVLKYLEKDKFSFTDLIHNKIFLNLRSIEDRYQVKGFSRNFFFSLFIEILRKLRLIKK
tara:strand:- start:48 stop:1040 length:993 start_codon:yes stop_codon:yes gene_type:complete